ncbi:MAG: protein adenylyltransferase SelO, partial [Pikeienuella sp.]
PLGAVLREYVVSEAMAAFNVPTTRALAAVTTGEPVYRERALPGAVLTRVAASHIRVGTFQYFAARQDEEALRLLADHVIARHYPEATEADSPYVSLLFRIVDRQASLIAKWMGLGFIHGVMNTDNMAVSGETIDFGPCAFMDEYHSMKVFSSIDQHARYAFDNQPKIAQWNLVALAQALLKIFPGDQEKQVAAAQAAIDTFAVKFHTAWMAEMRKKLALEGEDEGDEALIHTLLSEMEAAKADFTLTFRGLFDGSVRNQFADPTGFDKWEKDWRRRGVIEESLNKVNPVYIPRNHRVEAVIAAAEIGDFSLFHEMVDVLACPYDEQPGKADYALSPKAEEVVHQTFCGT